MVILVGGFRRLKSGRFLMFRKIPFAVSLTCKKANQLVQASEGTPAYRLRRTLTFVLGLDARLPLLSLGWSLSFPGGIPTCLLRRHLQERRGAFSG